MEDETDLLLHIGIDDTDSPRGGCTTYIAARLVERLLSLGARFIDYPNLLRLNPNVPWKTRGNGAICLRAEVGAGTEGAVRRAVVEAVETYSDFVCPNTNPGVVFHEGEIPGELMRFSDRVVQGVVTLSEAFELVDKRGGSAIGYKNMRGIIGALAAVGGLQGGDHTYEFLAYRKPENCGRTRLIDADSVRLMNERTHSSTFNNLDLETGRILITPRGPDPVLYGIRGETAESVYKAGAMVEPLEPVERWVIFRSNQGTDAHLSSFSKISEIEPCHPAIVEGEVAEKPTVIQGGHVIFPLRDDSGQFDCAAYEPTGGFRDVVLKMIPGDGMRAYGGIRENDGGRGKTLNLEKLEVLRIAPKVLMVNPDCPTCGTRMESMGRGKGYRCRQCGLRDEHLVKRAVEVERELGRGLYIPPPRAQRHLTKPLERYGREKDGRTPEDLFEPWNWVNTNL